ncbi:hypothetical protein L6164_027166 [Bauhinia variegata]|uniref:Uncharacterized protein n=1 Tax=Bauhinia variegata TaxID=167791 RepID=A0ACB9LSE2_BAUVA|nr:hypothetical protein L6164_027166 [Bauhinia variegata]
MEASLMVLVQAQSPSGFISIDCGLVDEPSYRDEITAIDYTSDTQFIGTGVSRKISSEYKLNSLPRQFWNVRSFPEGNRNCYTLHSGQGTGSSSKHLIRARFMYGNYDGKDTLPKFDIYLGSKWWDSVEFENASNVITKEVVSIASSDYVHVCLFNINQGTPFISVLEHRVLNSDAYLVNSLQLFARFDFGLQDTKIVRYPDDVYDRIWIPYNSSNLKHIKTSLWVDQGASSYSFLPLPPSNVTRTAAVPANAKIEKLEGNQVREFNVFVNGDLLNSNPVKPSYLESIYYAALVTEPELKLWINGTNRSTLPPLVNAIEIYMTKDLLQTQTDQKDVDAIMNIKSTYGIKRNWQGDPCTPVEYLWDGLNCSYAGSGPRRIISLNLSSIGLTGNIAPNMSNLRSLESLDLSNNSLTGDVPGSLSQLHSLKDLNLEENQLTGTVPMDLYESSKNGKINFRFGGNPDLCYPDSDSCQNKSNTIVISIVASVGGAFLLLAATVIFFIFKRRQLVPTRVSSPSSYYKLNKEVQSKKQQITSDEILSITNNFGRVLGKGGFGTVYHGYLGNTEVAVKVVSPSAQGYLQFQTEANLLTRVHHKCLTSLIGYCDEGPNVALIYEYMPNGNLAKHLSDKNEHVLSWKQRLQIAVDAAQGLEYMHKGCKPPIVHRDVKPSNILLDEKFRGKISDFGLSKIYANEGDTHVYTAIAGTTGYLDPQYNISNKLNEKSDVFSFGVVLLEMITGQPAIAKTDEGKTHIIDWLKSMQSESEISDIVDSRLEGKFGTDSARKLLDTAMACVASRSIDRPTMGEVVKELTHCLAMETSPSSLIHDSFYGISGESSLAR